jgi:hypothetical protein
MPVLLTVEEAGELLRIGRTKAYAMAREWRETDGRSGLPVMDLGHVLRVPRQALEELVGTELSDLSHVSGQRRVAEAPAAVSPTESERPPTSESEVTPVKPSLATRRTRNRSSRIANQLDLFNSESTSS